MTIAVMCVSLAVPSLLRNKQPIHLGSAATEVWILPPLGAVHDVVVFGHGWSTPLPSGAFAPWLDHLRSRGSLVIYPRYRVSAGDSTSSALLSFRAAVVAALRHIAPIRVPILALGKSFGASAIFYYAAEAKRWRVPGPAAVVSIFPAYPIGALPARTLPASVYVRILVGDRDTTAGSGGANAFWSWLAGHAPGLKRYVTVRSRPGFIANHDSAQSSTPVARLVFWRPVDILLQHLRHSGHP
jgi:acetyl esterase/lipase